MIKIEPFGSNILVKPVEQKQVLVNQTKSLCEYGEIIALGHDLTNETFLKVGDIIGYTVFGINSLEINGEKYYFIPYTPEFILGKITM